MATLEYYDGADWQGVTGMTVYTSGGTATGPEIDLNLEIVIPEEVV
jgi:hypothetical protein